MKPSCQPLQRMLGTPTALLIGMGVAIGSGIFRAPGLVAGSLQAPWLILLIWVGVGLIIAAQGLVTAELATRFPRAGGEYVYLKEAYGDFVAFFFGCAYTIFIIGGGAATIALAFGDFSSELFHLSPSWSGYLAAGAIVLVTGVNSLGLKTGAKVQNLLTAAKIMSLLTLVAIGLTMGEAPLGVTTTEVTWSQSGLGLVLAAMLPVLWAYDGTTDVVKLAEEIKDVRRSLPLAILGSTAALIVLYTLVNVALMRIVPSTEMAGLSFVPGEALLRLFGPLGKNAMLVVALLVCLSALSSTVLATIRVTFAQARDGLSFRFMGQMSKSQAPVPALMVVAVFSMVLVLNRRFEQVLEIYYLASAVLFGLSYASLIVFRVRHRGEPIDYFRCPFGVGLALLVIALQLGLAVNICLRNPRDALYTGVMFVALGLLYILWKRWPGHDSSSVGS